LIPVYLVTVVGGETECFKVLATEHVTSMASSTVAGALALLGGIVVAMPLARAIGVINKDLCESNRYPLPWVAYPTVLLLLAATVVLTLNS
jgi:hypothetical protein